jgi:fatty-acyl-CoA synthase
VSGPEAEKARTGALAHAPAPDRGRPQGPSRPSELSGPEARTFLDVLDALADAGDADGFTFVAADGSERTLGWSTLHRAVLVRGQALLESGVEAGDRVALIIPEPEEFIVTFLGATAVGLVPVPLYPPLALAKLDSYLDATARILGAASADLLVTTAQVEKVLWSVVARVPTLRDLVTVQKLAERRSTPAQRPDVLPSDPLFLQFTSGSTAQPKGVVVTHKSLLANAHAIVHDGLGADPTRDRGVSWLPLYHDMGLIGFVLAPLLVRIPVVFIPTLAFVKRPVLWLETIHRHRGTITFGPNFAFARVTKRASEADLARWDLSCLRIVGCGAEPINAGTMRAFTARFTAAGLRPETLLPCYGMAEATLAMTFVARDQPLVVDDEEVVSCGRPFPGHEIGVFGDDGARLPDGQLGEIRFRGPSVAGGYFRDPEATRAAFGEDGWLRTGDLGTVRGGALFVSGRSKDLLIVHGRNHHPQAIEWLVEEVPGVRKGNVVAFTVPGAETEELVVVAETAEPGAEERRALAAAVRAHLSAALSLVAADVVLLGVGELPKTTSGKLQRRKTREHYLARTLARDGVRTLGSGADRLALARHYVTSLAARLGHRAQSVWPISLLRGRRAAAERQRS